MTQRCRDLNRFLSAYVDHEATPGEMRAVEEHLQTCDACRARFQRMQRMAPVLDDQLQGLLARGERDGLRFRSRLRPPPALMLAQARSPHPIGRLATVGIIAAVCALVALVLVRSAPISQPTLPTAGQATAPQASPLPSGPVLAISIDGVVDPPAADYVRSSVATAESQHAAALIVSLAPSAGLDRSVQEVANELATSSVPTVAYLAQNPPSPTATTLAQASNQVIQSLPAGASIDWLQMDTTDGLWHRLLDPTTAYLFFVLGLFAVFVEIAHPGALAPALSGVLCMALAAIGFSTLPTNWLGVVALVAGVGLMGIELKAARHGILVLCGVVCVGLGSVMLYSRPGTVTPVLPDVAVPPAAVAGVVAVGLVVGVSIVRLAQRIHQLPPLVDLRGVIGSRGVARTCLDPEGVVHVHGQLWSARSRGGRVVPGEPVRVLARSGLVLEVESATFRGAATRKGANA
jgi:membrane-bound ClpP family serine protease